MKFFAMIDGEQRGPFTLEELDAAGVRPDTYVWCKGMDGWRKASEVADVCRYWRQRLSGTLPTQTADCGADRVASADAARTGSSEEVRHLRQVRSFDPEGPEPGVDINQPPRGLLLPAIIVCIMCSPLPGAVAIYFAYRTSRLWKEAVEAERSGNGNAEALKHEAHDSARSAKMWTGITFFIGVIAISYAFFKML